MICRVFGRSGFRAQNGIQMMLVTTCFHVAGLETAGLQAAGLQVSESHVPVAMSFLNALC